MKDPFIISSIILAASFLFILLSNQKLKSRVIQISFLILCIVFMILILVFDNSYIYELLKALITYFWYPNYLIFVTIIFISIVILIYTLLMPKLDFKRKVIHSLLFCIAFSCYIIFLRLDIDPKVFSSLYQRSSLLLQRIVTISFFVWLLVIIIFKLMDRGNHEK